MVSELDAEIERLTRARDALREINTPDANKAARKATGAKRGPKAGAKSAGKTAAKSSAKKTTTAGKRGGKPWTEERKAAAKARRAGVGNASGNEGA